MAKGKPMSNVAKAKRNVTNAKKLLIEDGTEQSIFVAERLAVVFDPPSPAVIPPGDIGEFKPDPGMKPELSVVGHINTAIDELTPLETHESILAIGKLKGALIKLGGA